MCTDTDEPLHKNLYVKMININRCLSDLGITILKMTAYFQYEDQRYEDQTNADWILLWHALYGGILINLAKHSHLLRYLYHRQAFQAEASRNMNTVCTVRKQAIVVSN